MRLVWLCNFIPLAWRAYISGLFPMQSQQHQKDIRTHDQQAWNIYGPYYYYYCYYYYYKEFKRATVACGKFKIKNSQSYYYYYYSKVPKVCTREKFSNCGNFLRKLGPGWKSQNSGRFLGKLDPGRKSQNSGRFLGKLGSALKCQNYDELRARAKFRRHMLKHNWKTYRATLDQGGIEPPTDLDRPSCICLVGHWLGRKEFFLKKYRFFGKIKNNDSPKIGVKSGSTALVYIHID